MAFWPFFLDKQAGKIHQKNAETIHDCLENFLTKIHSEKTLPWLLLFCFGRFGVEGPSLNPSLFAISLSLYDSSTVLESIRWVGAHRPPPHGALSFCLSFWLADCWGEVALWYLFNFLGHLTSSSHSFLVWFALIIFLWFLLFVVVEDVFLLEKGYFAEVLVFLWASLLFFAFAVFCSMLWLLFPLVLLLLMLFHVIVVVEGVWSLVLFWLFFGGSSVVCCCFFKSYGGDVSAVLFMYFAVFLFSLLFDCCPCCWLIRN